MKKLLLLITSILFLVVTNSNATSTAGIENTIVSGSDMAGMLVTVERVLTNNTQTKTEEWEAKQGNLGIAEFGSNWSLEFDGSDTWYSNNLDDPYFPGDPDRLAYWEFNTTKNISSITINAISGNFVFDIFSIWDDSWNETGFPNTEDSKDGWWQENSYIYSNTSGSGSDFFSWEFIDPITINGVVAPDLFGVLKINFDNPDTDDIEYMTGNLKFGVDTDKVAAVPVPATILLFGSGLLSLCGVIRRRKQ